MIIESFNNIINITIVYIYNTMYDLIKLSSTVAVFIQIAVFEYSFILD